MSNGKFNISHLNVRQATLDEIVSIFHDRIVSADGKSVNSIIFLTGPSGVGKSYAAIRLAKLMRANPVLRSRIAAASLDNFGSVVDGKWVIDTRKAIDWAYGKEAPITIFEGVSDNMADLVPLFEEFDDVTVCFVVPNPAVYARATALKAKEHAKTENPNLNWIKTWESIGKMSPQALESRLVKDTRMYAKKTANMLKRMADRTSYYALALPQEGVVASGWHRATLK